MSTNEPTKNEDPVVVALSRVADKCAECKDDWIWLQNPSIKGKRRHLVTFRHHVRKVVKEMIDEEPTGEEIFHQLKYQFFQILWPAFDEFERMAFGHWVEDLATSLGVDVAAVPVVVAVSTKPPVKTTKETAEVVSSDSDDENEKKTEEKEGDRVNDTNGSSPMSYDSSSPVDNDHAPPSPPAPLPDSPVASVSMGAAAPMDQDDQQVSMPADPPRRSPSQTERQEAFDAKQEAVQGVPIVVGYQSVATQESESQSEDLAERYDTSPTAVLQRVEAQAEHDQLEQIKKRLPEGLLTDSEADVEQQATVKRQRRTEVEKLQSNERLRMPTRTSSERLMRASNRDAQSPGRRLPVVAGWSPEPALTLT
jgi:hypothetical protein